MKNVMWHVALEPGTTKMQDVIVSSISVSDFGLLSALLSTNNLKGKVFEFGEVGYMIVYSGEYSRPFPSVIIWRLRITEDESFIEDMRAEDGWIVEQIWREWLMPEETDTEYVPPKQFIVMADKRQ